MSVTFISGQDFDQSAVSKNPLKTGEYEQCTFRNINFEHGDFSGFVFNECEFIGCNLSLIKLTHTAFREVIFNECKMAGLHFSDCNGFNLKFSFENCILNHSVFYKTDIRKTSFTSCQLTEVDFAECNLSSAVFTDCNLSGAIFDNTDLEGADFRTSFNYQINPTVNRLKNARFSRNEVHGLLHNFKIKIE